MIVFVGFHTQIFQFRMKAMEFHVSNKGRDVKLLDMAAITPLTG